MGATEAGRLSGEIRYHCQRGARQGTTVAISTEHKVLLIHSLDSTVARLFFSQKKHGVSTTHSRPSAKTYVYKSQATHLRRAPRRIAYFFIRDNTSAVSYPEGMELRWLDGRGGDGNIVFVRRSMDNIMETLLVHKWFNSPTPHGVVPCFIFLRRFLISRKHWLRTPLTYYME